MEALENLLVEYFHFFLSEKHILFYSLNLGEGCMLSPGACDRFWEHDEQGVRRVFYFKRYFSNNGVSNREKHMDLLYAPKYLEAMKKK